MFNQQARWDRKMPGDGGSTKVRRVASDCDGEGEWEYAEVLARFAKGRITPREFIVAGNRRAVERVNFAWTERRGNGLTYYFSVSDKSDSYRLWLDTETMSWRVAPLQ